MALFAQAGPMELGAWMLCAATALSMANSGAKFWDRLKGKPPAEQLAATGDLLEKRVNVVENTIDRVAHDQDERRRAIYAELGKIKDDMNQSFVGLSREVAALQSNSDMTNQRLVQLDSKLDRLIERKH